MMPMKNFISVRLMDPAKCSDIYSTVDVGDPGGMLATRCVLKEDAGKANRMKDKNSMWRAFGATQRYIVPIGNVSPCKKRSVATLCPKNLDGISEIKSIEAKFGPIIKQGDHFTVTKLPSSTRRMK